MKELDVKLKRVRKFLGENRLEAVLLSRQANFSWITCGGDSHVVMGSEQGVASALVTKKNIFIVTNNIETLRIKNEELENGFKILSYNWYEENEKVKLIRKICSLNRLGTDTGFAGAKNITKDFAGLRYRLTSEEIKRYEALGKDCAISMDKTCRCVKKGDTEHEIAAKLAKEMLEKGIAPIVLLVAADDRIKKYRHPIPTFNKVKKYAMLVLCGKRYGLILSMTRIVHFGKLSAELKEKHSAVLKADACFILGTKPGKKISDIFRCAADTYKYTGYADEWKLHHQGGATGYEGRDYKGTPGSNEIALENQAFAWNPSITGTKSEDTIITTGQGIKVISVIKNWPMITLGCCGEKIKRPDILIK